MLSPSWVPRKQGYLQGRLRFQRRKPTSPGTWSFPPRSTESREAGAGKRETATMIRPPRSRRSSLPLPHSPRYSLLPLAAPGCVHFGPSGSSGSSRSSRVGGISLVKNFGCPRRLPQPDSFWGCRAQMQPFSLKVLWRQEPRPRTALLDCLMPT